MKFIIVTNNPLIKQNYDDYEILYYDVKYEELLQIVKNKIALGHILLTHPLSGSVKPKETPYKSVMISKDFNKSKVDINSLEIIENAIMTCKKFDERKEKWTENVLLDFQYIDYTLIDSAIN